MAIEWVSKASTIVAGVTAAALVGHALAAGVVPGSVATWLVVLAGLVVIKAITSWFATLVSHRLAFRVLAEIRHWVYWSLERSAPASMIKFRGGDVLARTMGDAEALEVFYAHAVVNACVGITLPLVVVVFVGVTGAWPLAGLLVIGLVVAGLAPVLVIKANTRQGAVVRDRAADVANEVAETVDGMRELIMFDRVSTQRSQVIEASRRLAAAQRTYRSRGGAELSVGHLVLGLTVVAIAVLGGSYVGDGALDPAWLPAVVMAAAAAFTPVADLVNGARVAGLLGAASRRLFEVLQLAPSIDDRGSRVLDHTGAVAVSLDDVGFRYPGADRAALRSVSLDITAGETVALVGRSGAGKSTLAHLLLRWWDPTVGVIRIDQTPLPDLPYQQLTEHVAYVPQDVFLFHDTLRANLLIGSPSATDHQLSAACDRARLTSVIDTLDEGLDTVVGQRGSRLSGGERQRVAIARALLRDTGLLVLDESSSQLDTISEREIQIALDRGRGQCTTVVIAHRLSTILTADRIALLDQGRIVDVGSHEELMGRCPAYTELVAPQLDQLDQLEPVDGPPGLFQGHPDITPTTERR